MFGKVQRAPSIQARLMNTVAAYNPAWATASPIRVAQYYVDEQPMAALGCSPGMDANALRGRVAAFHETVVVNPLTGRLYSDVPVSIQSAFQTVLTSPSEAAIRVYGNTVSGVLDSRRIAAANVTTPIAKTVPVTQIHFHRRWQRTRRSL